jgi:hypothetical protein
VSYLVRVPVGDESVLVEIREPDDGLVRAARPGRVIAQASESFDEMLDRLRPVAEGFVTRFRTMVHPPSEITVEFGVTLSAEADVVIASASTEANFTVSLSWTRED